MNISDMKEQKSVLLQVIQNNLDAWDETADGAVQIFEANQPKFEKLQELEAGLSVEDAAELNVLFKDQLEVILENQQKLLETVAEEKQHIQEQLGQLGQKNKVISNYIAMQNKSLFVERNY